MDSELNKRFGSLGLHIPQILMPNDNIDIEKWAVVACDQFSSDKSYWEGVRKRVGEEPSSLDLILPEAYLDDTESRIALINQNMKTYLRDGTFKSLKEGCLLVDRSTPWVSSRKGLIIAIDLEHYSYLPDVQCQIRPTEGTVLERLPVRAAIRKEACLDLPHILVLFNDPEDRVFRALEKHKESFTPQYDFDLGEKGGHIKGDLIWDNSSLNTLIENLEELNQKNDFLFAIGDGNHSLGAAKQLWEQIKAEGGPLDHPARFALVELENIHDKGVAFEPIHRVIFDQRKADFLDDLKALDQFNLVPCDSFQIMAQMVNEGQTEYDGRHKVGLVSKGEYALIEFYDENTLLAAEGFHSFLDPWLKTHKNEIEYIHGDEPLRTLSEGGENLSFYLPKIDKSHFFKMISEKGPLPRKTFSIGEAEEKRYYLESRQITLE